MDNRVRASITLDPVDSAVMCDQVKCPDVSNMLPIDIPLGFVGETLDGEGGFMPCAPAADNFLTYYKNATAPALAVTVNGANHMSFIDDVASCGITCNFCKMPTLTNKVVNDLSRAYVVAFYSRYLKDIPATTPTSPAPTPRPATSTPTWSPSPASETPAAGRGSPELARPQPVVRLVRHAHQRPQPPALVAQHQTVPAAHRHADDVAVALPALAPEAHVGLTRRQPPQNIPRLEHPLARLQVAQIDRVVREAGLPELPLARPLGLPRRLPGLLRRRPGLPLRRRVRLLPATVAVLTLPRMSARKASPRHPDLPAR
jgi:hypothetical protein